MANVMQHREQTLAIVDSAERELIPLSEDVNRGLSPQPGGDVNIVDALANIANWANIVEAHRQQTVDALTSLGAAIGELVGPVAIWYHASERYPQVAEGLIERIKGLVGTDEHAKAAVAPVVNNLEEAKNFMGLTAGALGIDGGILAKLGLASLRVQEASRLLEDPRIAEVHTLGHGNMGTMTHQQALENNADEARQHTAAAMTNQAAAAAGLEEYAKYYS
jgi:hypothetical protein